MENNKRAVAWRLYCRYAAEGFEVSGMMLETNQMQGWERALQNNLMAFQVWASGLGVLPEFEAWRNRTMH